MSFSLWTLPSFWGVIRSFPVALLLHVYVPPSHCDGDQRKAFLQRPCVHHGFHIRAFLSPVLIYTQKKQTRDHSPNSNREPKLALTGLLPADNLYETLPHPFLCSPDPAFLPSPHCLLPKHSHYNNDCFSCSSFTCVGHVLRGGTVSGSTGRTRGVAHCKKQAWEWRQRRETKKPGVQHLL